GFQTLYQDFPALEWFEKHENLPRRYNSRPHNRYLLSYEKSIYHTDCTQGVIKHGQLAHSWQIFIKELQSSEYRNFIKKSLGVTYFNFRLEWHIGVTDSEVSPHCDAKSKLGTHIFYFNNSKDWSMEWGGATIVLGNKRKPAMNPEFEDFDLRIPIQFLDNQSFF